MRDCTAALLFILAAVSVASGALLAINYIGSSDSHEETKSTNSTAPQADEADRAAQDCFGNPGQASCAGFRLADGDALQDLKAVCNPGGAQQQLVGCSLWSACQAGQASGRYCAPFSALGTVCSDVPSSVAGCKRWTALCGQRRQSQVKQCQTEAPLPNALPTLIAQAAVDSLCADMADGGCRECAGGMCPKPLDTLSKLCRGMPSMPACASFSQMCQTGGTDFPTFCAPGTSWDPPMRSYFHLAYADIILFRDWVPRTGGQYLLACVAVIAVGVLSQATKAARVTWEASWQASRRPPYSDLQPPEGQTHDAEQQGYLTLGQFRRNLVRASFTGASVTLDFLLMLVAMTFNGGLFLCVVGGLALGVLLLGHIGERSFKGGVQDGDKWGLGEQVTIASGSTACHSAV